MEQTFNDQLNSNKAAFLFVVKLLFFYLLFSQGNILMNGMMSEGGKFYSEFISNHLNYIQGLKSALIIPAVWLIKLFGFYAIYNQSDVMVVDGPYLQINYDCLGLGVMSFLVAFVIAFPAKIKDKANLLIFGLLLIYLLNLFRIFGLGVILAYFESQRNNFTYHHEVFNILVYLSLFALLYFWIKQSNKPIKIDGDNAAQQKL